MRHEPVENAFPVSQPHYSKRHGPFTKPNLTDFFELRTYSLVMEIGQIKDMQQSLVPNVLALLQLVLAFATNTVTTQPGWKCGPKHHLNSAKAARILMQAGKKDATE